jgi:superfamily II DNA or RNA helicase
MDVTVERVGNLVVVRPWVPQLEELLTCTRRVREWHGYNFVTEKLFAVPPAHNGQPQDGLVYGGLFNRVYTRLQTLGHQVQVIDRQRSLPSPDYSQLPPLRQNQPELLATVIASSRALIEAPTGLGKSFIIKVLVGMFPALTILVVSRAQTVCNNLYEGLREAYPEQPIGRLFGTKQTLPEAARIIVATTRSMWKLEPDKVDMLIFDEAHNAAAPEVSGRLAAFTKTWMVGFSATPLGRDDGTDMITEAFFGPVLHRISWKEAEQGGNIAHIVVKMLRIKLPEIDIADELTRMRTAYWLNGPRNRALLQFAERTLPADAQVLYYVDRVEHGLAVRRFLPGVPFVHAGIGSDRWADFKRLGLVTDADAAELLHPNVSELTAAFKEGTLRRAIATSVWKEGVDFPDLHALVRFDGGRGLVNSVQLAGRLTRIGSDQQKRFAVLIDAYDDFGAVFRRRSSERLHIYQKKGWTIERA